MRRVDYVARHLEKPGEDRDGDERDGPPDHNQDDHPEALDRIVEPVVVDEVAEMQLREEVIDDAELVVEHPLPDVDGDDHRCGPHEDEGAHQQDAHRVAHLQKEHRDQRAKAHSQGDAGEREGQRADDDLVEEGVGQDRLVVAQADPFALVCDQLAEAVVLQRQPDQHAEGEGEDARDHRDARRDQRVGKEPAPEALVEGRPQVRRRDRQSHEASPLLFVS